MDMIFPIKMDEECRSEILFIRGPSSTARTTLALQAAVTAGSREKKVLFVSSKKLSQLPCKIEGMEEPTPLAMSNIHFMYTDSIKTIQAYLSEMHMPQNAHQPSIIIIDGLDCYINSEVFGDMTQCLMQILKIVSICEESTTFARLINNCDCPTTPKVILTWNDMHLEPCLNITNLEEALKIVNASIYRISMENNEKEKLKLAICQCSPSPKMKISFLVDSTGQISNIRSNCKHANVRAY